MKRYKLTAQNMQTYGGCQWELDVKKKTSGKGDLCNDGWLHVYTHPLLAVLLNPIHANFKNPRLFECECGGLCKTDNGLKEGWMEVTLVKELDMPQITTEQKVKFAIYCALEVYKEKSFVTWAEDWLSGKDRSALATADAADAARAARAARASVYAMADAARAADIDLIALAEKACGEDG